MGDFLMNTKLVTLMTVLVMAIVVGIVMLIDTPADEVTTSVIVQAADLGTAAGAVRSVGGEITHELGVIRAVGAELTESQRAALQERGISLHDNASVELATVSGGDCCYVNFPELVDAHLLHNQGIDGSGVTVGVLDSGLTATSELQRLPDGTERKVQAYNAIKDKVVDIPLDRFGHGSHMASIILNSSSPLDRPDRYNSIAPMAKIVPVKAFDKAGFSTYANVIRGIDWLLEPADVNAWVPQE